MKNPITPPQIETCGPRRPDIRVDRGDFALPDHWPNLSPHTLCPLPIYWRNGPEHLRGTRIEFLPRRFREYVLRRRQASAGVLAALKAVEGKEAMAFDQWEGR